jgi:hypothetical protein
MHFRITAQEKTMTKKLDPKAKIVVLKKDIPFRTGTAVHKRAQAVYTGRTVEGALKRGARTSTVRWLVTGRYVKVAA